ncbi:MAG: two-component regulator propeller domain-containing protein [Flavitalea sp.]
MRGFFVFMTLLLTHLFCNAQGLPPIGEWREHLPYQQAIALESSDNKIWVATPFSLYQFNTSDNSIERFSKVSGLSQTGIRTIGQDQESGNIIVAYNDGNIDLINDGDIENIPDIANSALVSDKQINQVFAFNGTIYLAGNESVFVVNTVNHEIRDTYIIGQGGVKSKVFSLTVFNNKLYAATSEGIRTAQLNSTNLADFRNWQTITDINIPAGAFEFVAGVQGKLIASQQNRLYSFDGNTWSAFYNDDWQLNSMQQSNEQIILNQTRNNVGRILILSNSGIVMNTIQNALVADPFETLALNNDYWIADRKKGFSKISASGATSYNPSSPSDLVYGAIVSEAGKTTVVSGSPVLNWNPQGYTGALNILNGGGWQSIAAPLNGVDSIRDLVSVATDKSDQSTWAGSLGSGLLHYKTDGTWDLFTGSSFIGSTYFAPDQYRVSGLQFDNENNLWISNYGADQNLIMRKQTGEVLKFRIPFPLAENAVSQIVIDDLNQKWVVSPKGNGLVCFNHGSSVENNSDDQWKWYRSGAGNGNLPHNNVLSIAKDKDGFIWVGTERGVAIIRCIQDVFSANNCEAFLPVVQFDNFAGYLFSNEQVQAIAIDGANRKWIGTRNGLWLISADGEKIIYRFSDNNSPLPANDVRQLSIDPKSGEVFIGTSGGLISFRSTATEGTEKSNELLVFPNPVPPGYTGTIAIRGVANNAIVKITELNGNLVYQMRALGGQAVWNGKDYRGRQISSGVYLVLISDDQRQDQVAAKIIYIKK